MSLNCCHREILGQRVNVQLSVNESRNGRRTERDEPRRDGRGERAGRHSENRVRITGLPDGIDWRDLKDFLRETVIEPAVVNTVAAGEAVADFRYPEDVDRAVSRLDDTKFRGSYIRVRRENNSGGGFRSRDSGERGRDYPSERERDDRHRDYGRGGRDGGRDRSRDRRSRSRDRR